MSYRSTVFMGCLHPMPDCARLLKRVFDIDPEHCVEFSPLGSMQSPKNHARGEFSPNTARLTACRAGDIVAGSQKKRLNFLFAANRLMLGKAGNTEAGHLEFASDAPKLPK